MIQFMKCFDMKSKVFLMLLYILILLQNIPAILTSNSSNDSEIEFLSLEPSPNLTETSRPDAPFINLFNFSALSMKIQQLMNKSEVQRKENIEDEFKNETIRNETKTSLKKSLFSSHFPWEYDNNDQKHQGSFLNLLLNLYVTPVFTFVQPLVDEKEKYVEDFIRTSRQMSNKSDTEIYRDLQQKLYAKVWDENEVSNKTDQMDQDLLLRINASNEGEKIDGNNSEFDISEKILAKENLNDSSSTENIRKIPRFSLKDNRQPRIMTKKGQEQLNISQNNSEKKHSLFFEQISVNLTNSTIDKIEPKILLNPTSNEKNEKTINFKINADVSEPSKKLQKSKKNSRKNSAANSNDSKTQKLSEVLKMDEENQNASTSVVSLKFDASEAGENNSTISTEVPGNSESSPENQNSDYFTKYHSKAYFTSTERIVETPNPNAKFLYTSEGSMIPGLLKPTRKKPDKIVKLPIIRPPYSAQYSSRTLTTEKNGTENLESLPVEEKSFSNKSLKNSMVDSNSHQKNKTSATFVRKKINVTAENANNDQGNGATTIKQGKEDTEKLKTVKKREIPMHNENNLNDRQELATYFHNGEKIKESYLNYAKIVDQQLAQDISPFSEEIINLNPQPNEFGYRTNRNDDFLLTKLLTPEDLQALEFDLKENYTEDDNLSNLKNMNLTNYNKNDKNSEANVKSEDEDIHTEKNPGSISSVKDDVNKPAPRTRKSKIRKKNRKSGANRANSSSKMKNRGINSKSNNKRIGSSQRKVGKKVRTGAKKVSKSYSDYKKNTRVRSNAQRRSKTGKRIKNKSKGFKKMKKTRERDRNDKLRNLNPSH